MVALPVWGGCSASTPPASRLCCIVLTKRTGNSRLLRCSGTRMGTSMGPPRVAAHSTGELCLSSHLDSDREPDYCGSSLRRSKLRLDRAMTVDTLLATYRFADKT